MIDLAFFHDGGFLLPILWFGGIFILFLVVCALIVVINKFRNRNR